MPAFQSQLILPRPVSEVFSFFLQPVNLIHLAPPETKLQLVEGPERLHQGARLTWKGQRMGVAQQMVIEVLDLEPDRSLTLAQAKGPLRRFVHTHTFAETDEGTHLHDHIDFEPPGGILGLIVTAEFIHSDLQSSFGYRAEVLRRAFART
jgi:ligand-binding SRPBCC domain-containing protein